MHELFHAFVHVWNATFRNLAEHEYMNYTPIPNWGGDYTYSFPVHMRTIDHKLSKVAVSHCGYHGAKSWVCQKIARDANPLQTYWTKFAIGLHGCNSPVCELEVSHKFAYSFVRVQI